jgi:hypothetical protein
LGEARYRLGHRYEWRAKPCLYSPLVSYVHLTVTSPDGKTIWLGAMASTRRRLPATVGALLARVSF